MTANEVARPPVKTMIDSIAVPNTFISGPCMGIHGWIMVSIAAVQTLKYKNLFTVLVNIVYLFISYALSRRKADQLKEQICTSKDINSAETLACQQQLRVYSIHGCYDTLPASVFTLVWPCPFRLSTNKCWH